MFKGLPDEARGLRLCRIDSKERLFLCEPVMFVNGAPAVDTVLRRAQIAGKVEVGAAQLGDYFADVLDREGAMIENVALDQKSYRSLKTRWMRCKVEKYA